MDKGKWKPGFPTAGRFRSAKYRIIATSPGTWAAGLRVSINYDLNGPVGIPILSMTVQCEGEPTEHIRQLSPGETEPGKTLEELVAKQSRLIRVEALDTPDDRLTYDNSNPLVDGYTDNRLAVSPGPQSIPWSLTLQLPEPVDVPTQERSFQQYKIAIDRLADQTEVAIISTPSIYLDIENSSLRQQVYQHLIATAVETQDRLVLIDAPRQNSDDSETVVNDELGNFVDELRLRSPDRISQRAVAVYHPWLRVSDPLADATNPLRTVPPSGHVAGVMSRVDRERGSHHTPANVVVHDAVDIETLLDRNAGGPLIASGINLVRCVQGKGLMIWGGRTLDLSRDGRFIAHRRFIHRLIRAIGRVANPVVFDTNGLELWLILVRAVTTVLLEAFRGGALQGARPEEAFRVRCNDQTSPLSEREQGRVLCEIDLALAAPMEFITIRVSVSREGRVEVFDA